MVAWTGWVLVVGKIVNDSDILRVARGDGPRARASLDQPCQLGGTSACLDCPHDYACGGLSLQAVGDSMGISRERVRQIERTALRKVRHKLRLLEFKTRGAPGGHSPSLTPGELRSTATESEIP